MDDQTIIGIGVIAIAVYFILRFLYKQIKLDAIESYNRELITKGSWIIVKRTIKKKYSSFTITIPAGAKGLVTSWSGSGINVWMLDWRGGRASRSQWITNIRNIEIVPTLRMNKKDYDSVIREIDEVYPKLAKSLKALYTVPPPLTQSEWVARELGIN